MIRYKFPSIQSSSDRNWLPDCRLNSTERPIEERRSSLTELLRFSELVVHEIQKKSLYNTLLVIFIEKKCLSDRRLRRKESTSTRFSKSNLASRRTSSPLSSRRGKLMVIRRVFISLKSLAEILSSRLFTLQIWMYNSTNDFTHLEKLSKNRRLFIFKYVNKTKSYVGGTWLYHFIDCLYALWELISSTLTSVYSLYISIKHSNSETAMVVIDLYII